MPPITPDDDDLVFEPRATTVRMSPEEDADVRFVADLWNRLDEAQEKRRARKFKRATVLLRAFRSLKKGLAEQLGGWPTTDAEREQYIADAVAAVKPRKAKH